MEQTRSEDVAAVLASHPQPVPVNVYEADDALVVVAPLPGVMAEDVKVTFASGKLSIDAAMRTPAPKDYLVHEWHYGPFHRDVDVPAGFGSGVEASFGNGQLAVRVLRGVPAAEPQRVVPTSHGAG